MDRNKVFCYKVWNQRNLRQEVYKGKPQEKRKNIKVKEQQGLTKTQDNHEF